MLNRSFEYLKGSKRPLIPSPHIISVHRVNPLHMCLNNDVDLILFYFRKAGVLTEDILEESEQMSKHVIHSSMEISTQV